MQRKVQIGDVIEIIRNAQRWAVGCLAVVDGVYPWGVTGYIPKPFLAHAGPTKVYIRADFDEIYLVGAGFLKIDTGNDQPSEH